MNVSKCHVDVNVYCTKYLISFNDRMLPCLLTTTSITLATELSTRTQAKLDISYDKTNSMIGSQKDAIKPSRHRGLGLHRPRSERWSHPLSLRLPHALRAEPPCKEPWSAMQSQLTCFGLMRLRAYAYLPRWSADIRDAIWILKHLLSVLKRLASSLWEEEDDVDQHGQVEDTEDDVDLVSDGFERRGHEGAKRGVEGPVGGGGLWTERLAGVSVKDKLHLIGIRTRATALPRTLNG